MQFFRTITIRYRERLVKRKIEIIGQNNKGFPKEPFDRSVNNTYLLSEPLWSNTPNLIKKVIIIRFKSLTNESSQGITK